MRTSSLPAVGSASTSPIESALAHFQTLPLKDAAREPMQNNPKLRQRPGQRGLKPETLPPLLPSPFSRFIFQSGQLFSSIQIPVYLGFLAKKTHDGPLVVNEMALSYAL